MLRNRNNRIARLKMIGALHCNDDGEGGSGGGGSGEGGEGSPSVEDLQSQLNAISEERDKLKAHSETLLSEAKAAKNAKREAEAKAQAEAEAKAKEAGDHEQLYKSATEKLNATLSELEEVKGGIANEKRNTAALKLATELADGANAELLSEFIARRLKYTEEGLKVTNSGGELTVSSLDDLKNEFKSDARYAALLKGNQSSGGGAAGGSNGGSAAKTLNRAEFEALNQKERMDFTKSGGKVIRT